MVAAGLNAGMVIQSLARGACQLERRGTVEWEGRS